MHELKRRPAAWLAAIRCADASARAAGLRCAYFTLLREPVATAVSAYNYFCRGCAENGRHCAAAVRPTRPRHPAPHAPRPM